MEKVNGWCLCHSSIHRLLITALRSCPRVVWALHKDLSKSPLESVPWKRHPGSVAAVCAQAAGIYSLCLNEPVQMQFIWEC